MRVTPYIQKKHKDQDRASLGADLTVDNCSLDTQLDQDSGRKIKLMELKEEKGKK